MQFRVTSKTLAVGGCLTPLQRCSWCILPFQPTGLFDQKWEPYYGIVVQTESVSFLIWDQMSGKIKRVHTNDLKQEIDDWEYSEVRDKRRKMRK